MSDGDLRTSPLVTEADRRPLVVALDDAAALDPALTGGKAAALARGRTAGLATLPGVVLTTGFSDAIDAGAEVATHAAVREAFERVGGDRTALVARSSSVVEDLATSSMAGQFDSVIGIRGFDAFVDAVTAVLGLPEASRRCRASDRRARPALDRAGVRRRDVRRRSGDGSHRPPRGERGAWEAPSRW